MNTSYRKAGTKAGRYTSNGFIETSNVERYQAKSNAGVWLFFTSLSVVIAGLVMYFS